MKVIVTYFDRSVDPRHPALFVSDKSGGVFIELSTLPGFEMKPGDLISISGVTGLGDYAPIVKQATARLISAGHLPNKAPRVDYMTLLTGATDGQWVEVEGVVHSVRYSGSGTNVFFDLALKDGTLVAQTLKQPGVDYAQFVDETILLRGDASPLFNHWGQMTGSQLVFPDISSIKVEQKATASLFDSSVEKLGDVLRYKPSAGLPHRVHIEGRVTLQWPGRLLCLYQEGQNLCAETSKLDRVQPGDVLDVVGFPVLGTFGPSLSHAFYRRTQEMKPLAPVQVTSGEIFQTVAEATLISIEGRLIGLNEAAQDPTIVLATDNLTYTAVLPREIQNTSFHKLENGSILRITGICFLQTDKPGQSAGSGFPIVSGFHVFLRTPSDIVVLQRPSWWNARHSSEVLAFALIVTFGMLLRTIFLSKRIEKQTQTILESEKRFRFLATHDSLTQLPNRHTVLACISSAVQLAQTREQSACIALVDLDHFKSINDTYGHLAGDEVLRQAAMRLAVAVRETDCIGRYGGEEFLIVFHGATETIGLARCEEIRAAICSEPIRYETNSLSVSCSIGVASVDNRTIRNATALIGLADAALYRAKANGRNRVERSIQG